MLKIKGPFFTWNWSRALVVFAMILMAGMLYGCSKGAVKKELITFKIKPDRTINDERPVYLLIRKVNKTEFLTESYNTIADTAFANPPDESVLARLVLLPGQNEKISFTKPDKADLGVYVLFASPGDQWKLLLEKPLKSEYSINLKNNELLEYRKGLFW
jgi:hypothetical protein